MTLKGSMILKEGTGKKKVKLFICIPLFLLILIISFSFLLDISKNNKSNERLKDVFLSEEFLRLSGEWEVSEYLGEAVEYHGINQSEEYQKENATISRQIIDSYLGTSIDINKNSLEMFYSPNELGFYFSDIEDVYAIFRQPSDILENMEPPYLCVKIRLKDYVEDFCILMDQYGETILEIKASFFRIKKK